jgi:hypothetical protein
VVTRTYAPTTREALFLLSRGNCYAPECKNRIMEWAGGRWVALADVAHIYGLNKRSRRYDERIPEPDRNNFKNLLLLCEKHHKLVDGADTWANYPVVTLVAWKQDREGDLAGELGQLDWITQDTLHELMAEAIEDTQSRILEAIDGISTISGETLAVLKALVAETLKLPYLNPDDVASLERSADVLQVVIPEYVPQLSRSAVILQEVIEYAGILSHSTRHLVNLADYAEALRYATSPLENLGALLPQLHEVAESLSSGAVSQYREVASRMSDTADRISDSVDFLSNAELPAPTWSGQEPPIVRAVRVPVARWSWGTFWGGFVTCMAFVIAILSLWVAHAHK